MTTIAAQIDRFIADVSTRQGLKPNTLKAYRADLRLVAQVIQGPLNQVTREEIESFLATCAAASTRSRRAASLSRFFAWARRDGLCARDPTADLESVRGAQRLPRPVRPGDDLRAVERGITAAPQPYRLIFTLLRETGMRISEVLGLDVGDVTLEPGREGLHIREAKNRVERIAVLGPGATPQSMRGLRTHLKAIGAQPPHAPLFRSNRSTRLSYDGVRYQWEQICLARGLVDAEGRPRYTIHQLRHTRGSELLEQGKSLEIVQRVLGHRDIRSTQRYADLSEAQVRAALERS
jgi:integrase/recombinase XerD